MNATIKMHRKMNPNTDPFNDSVDVNIVHSGSLSCGYVPLLNREILN